MAETTATTAKPKKPATSRKPRAAKSASARAHFSKALEEARAGAQVLSKEAQAKAQALGKEAQAKAGDYRGKLADRSSDLLEEARSRGGQARDKAMGIANDGKVRASGAIASLGKAVAESAETIDGKLGPKYGDYARTAAQTMQDAADRLESKDLGELGDDVKDFIRQSPGLAIGLAAVAGFVVARMLRGSRD
jgi:hypothetical protein